jgi:hypothetical protein
MASNPMQMRHPRSPRRRFEVALSAQWDGSTVRPDTQNKLRNNFKYLNSSTCVQKSFRLIDMLSNKNKKVSNLEHDTRSAYTIPLRAPL